VLERPPTNIPYQEHTVTLGTLTAFPCDRHDDEKDEIEEHDRSYRVQWRDQELTGKNSMLLDMQHWGRKRKLDKSFVDKKD